MVLFHPLCHKILYEIFFCKHQAYIALFFYSIWCYLLLSRLFPCIYLYIFSDIFLTTLLFETGNILYWNYTICNGYSRAFLMFNSRSSISMVTISISLLKPLQFKAGYHINLWIPSVNIWSFLQSHLFIVISWIKGKQDNLQLIVEPCKGLSGKLLCYGKNNSPCFFFFSGFSKKSAVVDNYKVVFFVADRFGIAALLSYLKKLIYGYNNRRACTQQIHII